MERAADNSSRRCSQAGNRSSGPMPATKTSEPQHNHQPRYRFRVPALVARFSQFEGLEGPPTLPAVGVTLVVAPFAIIHCVRPQQGDHKGRPYIILKIAFHDARSLQIGSSERLGSGRGMEDK